MSKPFSAVNFQPNQLLDKSVLDQLSNNQVWLFDNMPSALYTYNAIRRHEGVRLVSGRTLISATKSDSQVAEVRFGNYFSASCNPIITTGLVSNGKRKFFVTIEGYGQIMPDNRGFKVHVFMADEAAGATITRNMYVTWQAMGY